MTSKIITVCVQVIKNVNLDAPIKSCGQTAL